METVNGKEQEFVFDIFKTSTRWHIVWLYWSCSQLCLCGLKIQLKWQFHTSVSVSVEGVVCPSPVSILPSGLVRCKSCHCLPFLATRILLWHDFCTALNTWMEVLEMIKSNWALCCVHCRLQLKSIGCLCLLITWLTPTHGKNSCFQ